MDSRVAPFVFKKFLFIILNRMSIKNCAIYTRVSTDIQAEKEFSSCKAQELKIRSFVASQQDWQIVKIYSDAGYSGATLERPAIKELLTDLKTKKVDVVLVYKIDRLTRSPKDFYQLIEFFEQASIDFISITERFDTSTPAGRLLRNIMLTFSQFERELTSERTKDKLLERAKKGLCSGGSTPLGYMRTDKKIVPHQKDSEIIKSIFETYVETQSMVAVYKMLKEKGVRSKQGNPFSVTMIDKFLRRQVYIGKVYHKGVYYDGIHEPLISQEIFDLAQKPHKTKTKNLKLYRHFLFGGLVRCQHCDAMMTASYTNKHRKGKTRCYRYYRCTRTTKHEWSSCPIRQVSAERLERYCLENLERISIDTDYLENLAFRINNDKSIPAIRGVGLSDVRPPFSEISSEMLAETLTYFVTSLAPTKGIERNLLAKKSIEKIMYAPDRITLSFWLKDSIALAPDSEMNTTSVLIENYAPVLKNEKPTFLESGKFVENSIGAGRGSRTLVHCLEGSYNSRYTIPAGFNMCIL